MNRSDLEFHSKYFRKKIFQLEENIVDWFHLNLWTNPMHYFSAKTMLQFPFFQKDIKNAYAQRVYKYVKKTILTRKYDIVEVANIFNSVVEYMKSIKDDIYHPDKIPEILSTLRLFHKFFSFFPEVYDDKSKLNLYPHRTMIQDLELTLSTEEEYQERKSEIVKTALEIRKNPKDHGVLSTHLGQIIIPHCMRLAEAGRYEDAFDLMNTEKLHDLSLVQYRTELKRRMGQTDYSYEINILNKCVDEFDKGEGDRQISGHIFNGYSATFFLVLFILTGKNQVDLLNKSVIRIKKQFKYIECMGGDKIEENFSSIYFTEPLYYPYIYLWPYYNYIILGKDYE